MIHRPFTEPDTKEWTAWVKKTKAERDKLVKKAEAGEDIKNFKINDKLYKHMKRDIFKAFDNKCAYCESKLLDQPGDVEHYRPKKGVTDIKNEFVYIEEKGKKKKHPGYYWLAYNWRNLLPSCIHCNRLSRTQDGRLVGKGNRFPVKEFRAIKHNQEEKEEPLLLNPMFDDPTEHFEFDEATGIFGPQTEKGKVCIEIFDLNREALLEARQQVYETVAFNTIKAHGAAVDGEKKKMLKALKVLNAYRKGEKSYSFGAQKAIEDFRDNLQPLYNFFNT